MNREMLRRHEFSTKGEYESPLGRSASSSDNTVMALQSLNVASVQPNETLDMILFPSDGINLTFVI